ncbi:hypothetical protein JCM17846_28680 [Iodidimonas nitroreducens]|uniref:Uncharacterized protein n=1 Tax=Iodidimonas nitroreducens TaxID=1236968 RepID=A0A5A7NE27_9PROT|nr:hypothetical protein [Iodidimonas nitroreducens]GAK34631.1 hypothetical protein AQ1_02530 [alpha proteobacterium Q-1]GER05186.1 hypothetical protein JCM17846_28680 [Iodidimonas nitroreducens]
MFKKNRHVGNVYKKETNWSAVVAAIFWGVVLLAILGSFAS